MTRRRIRVSTGRSSPAFHRSITTMSFRSTALNAYLEVISDNWRFAGVMSRSNMDCRAKSLRLFAGIAAASFCHPSISALAPSSLFSCSCLFVKFSLSVFIFPVSLPLSVFLYEVPPHKTTSFIQPSRPRAYTSDPRSHKPRISLRFVRGI